VIAQPEHFKQCVNVVLEYLSLALVCRHGITVWLLVYRLLALRT
jgi:hypothetical protein